MPPSASSRHMHADVVIQGLFELTRMWVEYSHDFRKDLQHCQVSAFFNGPVLSMAYGRNLGPDPLLEWHPCPVDSGITKNFAKVCCLVCRPLRLLCAPRVESDAQPGLPWAQQGALRTGQNDHMAPAVHTDACAWVWAGV